MQEKNVKVAVGKYLKSIGAYWLMPVQTGYGAATVDFLVCYNGRFYGIETKRPPTGAPTKGQEPTPRQALVMSAIIAAGGDACVEYDVNLPNVKKMLVF